MACLQDSQIGSRPLPNACRKIEYYSDHMHEHEVGEGVGDKELLTSLLAANCPCARLLAVHAPGIGHTFPLTNIYQLNVI